MSWKKKLLLDLPVSASPGWATPLQSLSPFVLFVFHPPFTFPSTLKKLFFKLFELSSLPSSHCRNCLSGLSSLSFSFLP